MALSRPYPSLRIPFSPPRRGTSSSRLPQLLLGGALMVTGLAAAPVRVAVVDGHSMAPSLNPGQPVLYAPVPKGERVEVSRGDLVLVRMGKQLCLKRVFATGGEAFWSFGTRGQPAVTHRLIEMNRPVAWWRQRFPKFSFLRTQVPAGSIWVLGDAPCSVDSRHLGPVRMENIVGKVMGGKKDPAIVAACVQAWSELPARAGHSHGYASSRLPGRPPWDGEMERRGEGETSPHLAMTAPHSQGLTRFTPKAPLGRPVHGEPLR